MSYFSGFFDGNIGVLMATLFISMFAFTILWVVNVIKSDAGVVDYYWGPGFAVITWTYAVILGITQFETLVFAGLVSVWGLKLAGQLVFRHLGETVEDARYAEMRRQGGESFWWKSLFTVFILQSIIMWIIATPIHMAMLYPGEQPVMTALFWLGVIIAVSGFTFESIADYQLLQGRKNTAKDRTFAGGLWLLSRHPNYAGEIVGWVGLGLASLAISGSLWSLVGPAVLAAVIIGISLPLTEQHMSRSRIDWEEHIKRVPKLWPGLPGRSTFGSQDPAE